MHIPEGPLSATPAGQHVLVAGAAIAAVGTAIGLYKLDYERIPRTAVLGAAFFVASAIQIPMWPTSVHLLLGGLMGLVLGWSTFPAVLVALVLQFCFFSEGGITTLGINTVTMAAPAVVCSYLFGSAARSRWQSVVFASGFASGIVSVLLGASILSGALIVADQPLATLSRLLFVSHGPIALIEGFMTGSIVVLLRKVRPEVLDASVLPMAAQKVSAI